MECYSCKEVFSGEVRKMVLPCLHTLCSVCLKDLKALPKTDHKCLVCKEDFDIGEVFFKDSGVACDSCSSLAAYGCKTCSKNLCYTHWSKHSTNKSTRAHECLPLVSENISVSHVCLVHPEKDVSLFCSTCQMLACEDCRAQEHQLHQFQTFEEARAQIKDILNSEVIKLKQRFGDLKSSKTYLTSIKAQLVKKIPALQEDVDSYFNEAIEYMEKQVGQKRKVMDLRRQALKDEVHNLLQVDIKSLDLQIQTIEAAQEQMDTIQESHTAAIAATTAGPVQQDVTINALRLHSVTYSRAVKLQKENIQLLPIATDCFHLAGEDPSDIFTVRIDQMGHFRRGIFDGDCPDFNLPSLVIGVDKGKAPGQFHHPTGIVQLGNSNIVVSDKKNKRLQVFTSQGKFIRQVALNMELNHLALSTNDELWVAGHEALLCLSSDFDVIRRLHTESPIGVAVSKTEEQLVVASRSDGQVIAFFPDGTVKWTTTEVFSHGKPNKFHQLVATEEGILACNYSRDCVQSISCRDGYSHQDFYTRFPRVTGIALVPKSKYAIVAQNSLLSFYDRSKNKVVNSWGSKGSGPGQFDLAGLGSITILHNGQIAIADYRNHRVQIF